MGAASGLGPFETKFQAQFVDHRSAAFESERKRRQDEYNAMLAHNHKHKTDGRDDARAELRLRAAQRVAANQASGVYFARTRLKQEQEKLREVLFVLFFMMIHVGTEMINSYVVCCRCSCDWKPRRKRSGCRV